jgi:hypothetical protein
VLCPPPPVDLGNVWDYGPIYSINMNILHLNLHLSPLDNVSHISFHVARPFTKKTLRQGDERDNNMSNVASPCVVSNNNMSDVALVVVSLSSHV